WDVGRGGVAPRRLEGRFVMATRTLARSSAGSGGGLIRLSRSLAVAVAVVLLAAAGARAQDVTLSVAAKLNDVTEELGRSFVAAHPGVTLGYIFSASGVLQKQIEST